MYDLFLSCILLIFPLIFFFNLLLNGLLLNRKTPANNLSSIIISQDVFENCLKCLLLHMSNLMRMFVVVSLENKLHFIFSKCCYKRNTTRIKSRLVSDFQNCPNYVSVLKRKPTELLWMNQLTGHLSLLFLKKSRD